MGLLEKASNIQNEDASPPTKVIEQSKPAPTPAKAPVKAPAPKKVVAKAEVKKVPTKSVLSSMTKKELDNFAKVEFDVKLDARLKKDDMIKALQKEAKAK